MMDKAGRQVDVMLRLSEFEMPPMQDVLLIGRQAPMGPEAARRMVEAIAPDQYEVCLVDDAAIEAIVVRRRLFDLIPKERMIELLLDEAEKFAAEHLVIKGRLNIDMVIRKQVSIE